MEFNPQARAGREVAFPAAFVMKGKGYRDKFRKKIYAQKNLMSIFSRVRLL